MSEDVDYGMESSDVVRQLRRVILHLDLDAFYAQVEEQRHPELKGKPIAVQQWRGLIAVGYKARDKGVRRFMKLEEAKEACPDLCLVHVDVVHEKVSLEPYRAASRQIFEVISITEKASVDEVYLDVSTLVTQRLEELEQYQAQQKAIGSWTYQTDHFFSFLDHEDEQEGVMEAFLRTKVVGFDNQYVGNGWDPGAHVANRRLLMGAVISCEIRSAVERRTGYRCSAGISHNKLLAKLGSGLHKPAGQVLLPFVQGQDFLLNCGIRDVPGLGGKLGKRLEEQALGFFRPEKRSRNTKVQGPTVSQLIALSPGALGKAVGGETARWLGRYLRCLDDRSVKAKGPPRSLLEAKSKEPQTSMEVVEKWLNNLANGLASRIEDDSKRNKRWPKTLTLSMRIGQGTAPIRHLTRSCGACPSVQFSQSGALEMFTQKITESALRVFKANAGRNFRATNLSLFVNFAKVEPVGQGQATLSKFLAGPEQAIDGRCERDTEGLNNETQEDNADKAVAFGSTCPDARKSSDVQEAASELKPPDSSSSTVDCPVCLKKIPRDIAEHHVNNHFRSKPVQQKPQADRGARKKRKLSSSNSRHKPISQFFSKQN